MSLTPQVEQRKLKRKMRWRELGWSDWAAVIIVPLIVLVAVLTPGYLLRHQQEDLSEQLTGAITSLHTQHAELEAHLEASLKELKCILVIPSDHRTAHKLHHCSLLAVVPVVDTAP
jgi:hypothetical protein